MLEVIDPHTHFGTYGAWSHDPAELIGQMDRAEVRLAIAGDLSGNLLGARSAEAALEAVRPYRDRLRLMLWVAPQADNYGIAERLLKTDRTSFACINVHPSTSRIPPGNAAYSPYVALCQRYRLPFVAHTEQDGFSDIDGLARMAEAAPDVPFIAVHMELRTDHSHAIGQIARHSNLYGDTSFVSAQAAVRAVEICSAEKLLFGTDTPIGGDRLCTLLVELKEALTRRFGAAAAALVLCGNCRRLMMQ